MSTCKSVDSAKERVMIELHDLRAKRIKLQAFAKSAAFEKLKDRMRSLLMSQLGCMEQYESILEERLKIWDD